MKISQNITKKYFNNLYIGNSIDEWLIILKKIPIKNNDFNKLLNYVETQSLKHSGSSIYSVLWFILESNQNYKLSNKLLEYFINQNKQNKLNESDIIYVKEENIQSPDIEY